MNKNKTLVHFLLPLRLISIGVVLTLCASAQSEKSPEDFQVEVTGSAWLLNPGGTIQASGSPIDLVNDLGAQQNEPTFYGRLVYKPGRRHRIVLEGTPFQIDGYKTINTDISYRGYTFSVSQTVQSNADMTYFFGGYQYDVLSGPMGHLGFSAGAAYLSATGTLTAVQTNIVESKSEVVGLPLAGAEFRVFPIPHRKILEIDGGMRGMGFGSYGHYADAQGNMGLGFGPITFQAGYRAVNADLHQTSNGGSGISVRLQGPIFGMQFRY